MHVAAGRGAGWDLHGMHVARCCRRRRCGTYTATTRRGDVGVKQGAAEVVVAERGTTKGAVESCSSPNGRLHRLTFLVCVIPSSAEHLWEATLAKIRAKSPSAAARGGQGLRRRWPAVSPPPAPSVAAPARIARCRCRYR
mmetsp:Transcript_105665/g.298856  ORF Transcript_105665/g.298856 Transcript_105665/m.298856 type:complete len:140 (-) Transcript_105665:1215-1634(-)